MKNFKVNFSIWSLLTTFPAVFYTCIRLYIVVNSYPDFHSEQKWTLLVQTILIISGNGNWKVMGMWGNDENQNAVYIYTTLLPCVKGCSHYARMCASVRSVNVVATFKRVRLQRTRTSSAFEASLYTASQLKWRKNLNPLKYDITQRRHLPF